jgi:hypothetical protein
MQEFLLLNHCCHFLIVFSSHLVIPLLLLVLYPLPGYHPSN